MKVRVCFEVCCHDVDGDSVNLGVALDVGVSKREVDYKKLITGVDKVKLLELTGLISVAEPEDVTFITPEEYEKRYGEED